MNGRESQQAKQLAVGGQWPPRENPDIPGFSFAPDSAEPRDFPRTWLRSGRCGLDWVCVCTYGLLRVAFLG